MEATKNGAAGSRIAIGLVGCGTVASYGHLPAMAASDEYRIAAVCDIYEPTARATAAQYGCQAYTDYREMIAKAGLDALVITTFEDTHPAILKAAAEAGIHIFCEKPLAVTLSDAAAMVETAEAHDVVFNCNFSLRLGDAIQAMRRAVTPKLGNLEVVRLDAIWDMHGLEAGDRRTRNLQYGALSCGIHDVDLVAFLTGQTIETAVASGLSPETDLYGPPGHIALSGHLSGGVLYTVQASSLLGRAGRTRTGIWRYDLFFDRGYVSFTHELDGAAKLHVLDDDGYRVTEVLDFHEKNWDLAYALFAQRVRGGTGVKNDLATGRDGFEAQVVCELAHLQAERCRTDENARVESLRRNLVSV